MVYCESCGAANTVDAEVCFACQKPIEEEQEQTLLPIITTTTATIAIKPELAKDETSLLPGSTLLHERYRVLKQVGTGGFGAVYKATDAQANNRYVAIKQINLKGLKSNEIIEATDTFNREVEILSDLEHKSLPRVYEHFTDPEHWYVVMDFIDGQTLEDYLLATKGRLPLDEILDLTIQICTVLEYLHTRVPPVIFRDLKPANVMLTPYKQIYLIDFGTARFFKPGKAKDTIAFGSPGYAAPEQYGKAQTTPRSDIYSLGATMHQLLTGKDPADAPFRFTSPRNSNPALPGELDSLIMNMIKMESKDRPADAYVVKAELQRIATEHGRRLYPLPNALPLYQPNPNRRPAASMPATFAAPATGFYSSGGAQGQSQMQFQVGATAQGGQAAQSPAVRKGGVSRRAIIGGLVVLSVLGPRLLGDWSQAQNQGPYTGDRGGSPDGNGDGVQQIYDSQMTFPQQSPVNDVSWSNMGRGDWIASSDTQGGLVVWRANSVHSVFKYQNQNQASINALAWSPDGQNVAFVDDQGKLTIVNWWTKKTLVSSQVVQSTQSTLPSLKTVAWSHDGQSIAFGGENQLVTVVNAQDPSQVVVHYANHSGTITSIAWSPDDKKIVSASSDATAQVWSPNSLQNSVDPNVVKYTGHSEEVTAVSWSPDGTSIASAGDDGLALTWDASSGTPITRFSGHSNAVTSVAWSPDGNWVASGSMDRTVQVWSPQGGSASPSYVYNGHSDGVTSIAWENDSRTIASGSTDMTVQKWELS